MNTSIYNISLDLHEQISPKALYVKRGDTVRELRVTITEDGKPYEVTGDVTSILCAILPTGSTVEKAMTRDGNILVAVLPSSWTATDGEVRCEVSLSSGSDSLLSPGFSIFVGHESGSIPTDARELPPITSADNGKSVVAEDGEWVKGPNLAAMSDYIDGVPTLLSNISGSRAILSEQSKYAGFINAQGKWDYTTTETYKYAIFPVNGGEYVSVTAQAGGPVMYSALRTYSEPEDGDAADFSEATGWTARKQVNSGTSATFNLPADARYIVITTLYNGADRLPVKFVLDGYDYTGPTADSLMAYAVAKDAEKNGKEIELFGEGGMDAPVRWELGSIKTSDGIGEPVSNAVSNTRWRTIEAYKTVVDLTVTTDSGYNLQIIYLEDDGVTLKSLNPNQPASRGTLYIPSGSVFRIIIGKNGATDISAVTITDYISVKFMGIAELLYSGNAVKWCAMGDSITEGYYSYYNDQDAPTSAKDASKAWVTKVAAENKWNVTNLGDGGTGWLDEDDYGGCAYKLARASDFSGYNLVTLAYGINDWKGNAVVHTTDDIPAEIAADVSEVSTPTTVIQAMKITIEAILASNPKCKVIGILPINCSRYGTKAGNYGLGYSFSNTGTLESFCEVLVKIYEYYGIQYIDMAHASVVNRENIETLLIDGVHPSEDCHTLMARELAKKITW